MEHLYIIVKLKQVIPLSLGVPKRHLCLLNQKMNTISISRMNLGLTPAHQRSRPIISKSFFLSFLRLNYLVGIEFILYVFNMKFIKHIFLLGLFLFASGCLTTTGSPGLTIGMSANRYSIHELQGN